MRLIALISLFLVSNSGRIWAQTLDFYNNYSFDGAFFDIDTAFEETYIAAGSINDGQGTNYKVALLDSNGNVIRSKTGYRLSGMPGNPGSNYFRKCRYYNNYFYCCGTASYLTGNTINIVKLDTSLNSIWDTVYAFGNGTYNFGDFLILNDTIVCVGSQRDSSTFGIDAPLICRFNSIDGSLIDRKSFPQSIWYGAASVMYDSDSYYLASFHYDTTFNHHTSLLKLNASFNQVWLWDTIMTNQILTEAKFNDSKIYLSIGGGGSPGIILVRDTNVNFIKSFNTDSCSSLPFTIADNNDIVFGIYPIKIFYSNYISGTASLLADTTGIANADVNLTSIKLDKHYDILVSGFNHHFGGGVSQTPFALKLRNVFTSIKNDSIKNILSVYPNPVSDVLHCRISEKYTFKNGKFEVFDAYGKLKWSQTIKDSKIVYDCSRLANGIYIIRITLNEGITSQQLFSKF